jgi:adenylate cyclase, class 2
VTGAKRPLETEVKFRVNDRAELEARLRDLGAAAGATEHETNILLDDGAGSLQSAGRALRVRESGERGLVTLKGKASFERGLKSRLELESEVASAAALLELFAELGYTPRFRYEKRRTTWLFADRSRPVVVVDETPIGLFAEIEGEPDAVRALARELEVREEELLSRSYVALYREAREKDPSLPADMLFPAGAAR